MTKPLLTVLMPVHNGEKYLREAIDSILDQSLTAFEFLIIDDGSTDNSVSIVQSYTDKRIRLVQNPANLGISATLNKGIVLSTTDLIARMDADDISYPTRLQLQYDYFQKNPDCVLLSTWARVITEQKEVLRIEKYNKRFYYYNLTFSCWIYHPTVMYKKNAVLDTGGYRSQYAEDYDLFWQLLRKYKIGFLEEVLLDYRVTSESLHQVKKKKEYDEAMEQQILRNIQYYAGNGLSLTFEEIQCLRFDFGPIIKLNSTRSIVNAFKKLEAITRGMLEHPNPNLNRQDVLEAWYFRKRYMRAHILKALSPVRALLLRAALLFGTQATDGV